MNARLRIAGALALLAMCLAALAQPPRLLLDTSEDVGGASRLIRDFPAGSHELGRRLFFREWTSADGLHLDGQKRAVSATFNACSLCHNLPVGLPGHGGVVFDPPRIARKVPHLFDVAQLEAQAASLTDSLNRRYDANGNGLLERDEVAGRRLLLRAHTGAQLDFGSLQRGEASLNPAVKLHYYDANGRRLYGDEEGAPLSLASRLVAGVRLVVTPFGVSVSDHQFASIDEFAFAVFRSAFAMPVSDPSRAAADACPALGVTTGEVQLLAHYLRTRGPLSWQAQTPHERRGLAALRNFQCVSCHLAPAAQRKGAPRLSAASTPLTDLLHHDLGPAFHEHLVVDDRLYTFRKFRTAPLWGVGSTAPYGHDGRSETLDDVIRRHGGEAARAAALYKRASPSQQRDLIAFLSSLKLARDRAPVVPGATDIGDSQQLMRHLDAIVDRQRAASAHTASDDVCRVSAPATSAARRAVHVALHRPLRDAHAHAASSLDRAGLDAAAKASLLARFTTEADGAGAVARFLLSPSDSEDEAEAARSTLLELKRLDVEAARRPGP